MTNEKDLQNAGNEMTVYANGLTIATDEDYKSAAEALTTIKTRMKAVQDYWKEPKAKAAAAHKEICGREKEMLSVLTEAENTVKKAMRIYVEQKEAERRKAEEEERKRREAEAEALLNSAIAAEENGHDDYAAQQLEKAEEVTSAPIAEAPKPKADGIAVRKVWKARVVDESKVPVSIGGTVVRPVDMSALNAVARTTKGEINVPGVEFYEDTVIAARG